jgi:glycosyltransferase involved in cell wall biosynthesis
VKGGRSARVSVGLPVYNGARYVGQAISALCTQTFSDIEIVIGDNASTDETEAICRQYASQDPRIRYYRHDRNLGIALNHQRVFELSGGEYFRWAGANDLSAPTFIERCVDVLDHDRSVVLAYPRTMLIDQQGASTVYEDRLNLPWEDPVVRFRAVCTNVRRCNAMYGLMRAKALRQTAVHGNFVGSDVCLLAELALYGKFFEVPEVMLYRQDHPASVYQSTHDFSRLWAFYHPGVRPGRDLRVWRHLLEHFRAVRRAPLSFRERMRLRAWLVRRSITRRRRLAAEVASVVRTDRSAAHAPGSSVGA